MSNPKIIIPTGILLDFLVELPQEIIEKIAWHKRVYAKTLKRNKYTCGHDSEVFRRKLIQAILIKESASRKI